MASGGVTGLMLLVGLPLAYRGAAWYGRYRLGGAAPWEVRRTPSRRVDGADGWLAFGGLSLIYLGGLIGGIAAAFWGLLLLRREPVQALLLLVAGPGLAYFALRAWRDDFQTVTLSRPGELEVPTWPLVEDAHVNLRYVREVNAPCRLRRLHGGLVLEERVRVRSYRSRTARYEWQEVDRMSLGGGDAIQKGERIEAVFKLCVPPPDGHEAYEGLARVWAFLGFAPARRWRLVVDLAIDGLPDRDSQFLLAVREASHGDPAGPARGRPHRAT